LWEEYQVSRGAQGQGSNSANIRQFNERVILAALRRLGEASKADLARAAQLTNNAAGQIVRELEQQSLIRTLGKRAGSRGQPATLLTLNSEGAYAIGITIGRRSLRALLVDFHGEVLERQSAELVWPLPEQAVAFIEASVELFRSRLSGTARARIAGLGVAMPDNMGSWRRELGIETDAIAAWNDFDLGKALAKRIDLPIFIENDGTAAAAAELFRGAGRGIADFLYLFIGAAIGGGVVAGGDFQRGMHGNAGDVGLMPVAPSRLASVAAPASHYDVLLSRASVSALIRHLNHRGFAVKTQSELEDSLAGAEAAVAEWIEDCADALVAPILSAVRLLDIDTVVIDGDLPAPLMKTLIEMTAGRLRDASPEARQPPSLVHGSIGPEAAAIGAAILPLHLNFSPNREVLTGR
jgi:predicted NBD/HSP70 family sugar kinase